MHEFLAGHWKVGKKQESFVLQELPHTLCDLPSKWKQFAPKSYDNPT